MYRDYENLYNYQPQPHEKLGSLLSTSVLILPHSFLNNKEISKCFEEDHTTNKQEVQESYPSLSTYKALLRPLETALEWTVLTEDQTKTENQTWTSTYERSQYELQVEFPATS